MSEAIAVPDWTPPKMEAPSAEEITRQYSAAMDSVNLLTAGKLKDMTDQDWADCKKRNVEHLEIMVAKDWMQSQNLGPLTAAIAANK